MFVPFRFCGGPDNDGHLFWECSFSPFVSQKGESLISRQLLALISLTGPGVCPGMVCYLHYLVVCGVAQWARAAAAVAKNRLEAALGAYVGALCEPFGEGGLEEAERDLAAGPLVWSDGSLVLDNVSGIGVLELVSTHMRLAYSDLLPPLPDGGG